MISVIVPIYNVEAYLPKCLESLAAQSFPDVEFILVDDGSTDDSGRIADAYSDSRFRVFHTANHGLSAARNYGMEQARGDWLMFVDGDDWVAPDFCETPYKAAVQNDADLVIFRAYSEKKDARKSKKQDRPIGIVGAETAIRYGYFAAWNKLYKRELFTSIRYPEGRVYEDIPVTHKLICQAHRIVMLPHVLYFRVYRPGSITNTLSAGNLRDGFLSALERAEDLKSIGYKQDLYEETVQEFAVRFLIRANPDDDPVFKKAEEVADSIRRIPSYLNVKKKFMLLIWRFDNRLFHFICRVFGKKHNL